MCTNYSKEKDISPKSNNKKSKDTTILETYVCPLIAAHEEHNFEGLSEEQDPRNLINGHLVDSKCSVWKKKLVNKNNI